MSFCSDCGTSQEKNQKFCRKCGASLERAIESEPVQSAHTVNLSESNEEERIDIPIKWTRKSSNWVVITVGLVIAIFVVFFVLGSGSSSNTNDSVTDILTNSSAATSTNYTDTIPTSEIVSTFSSDLGVTINQDDPSGGVTFPDVSSQVDFWSVPYVTLLIYPDASTLTADNANFLQDFNSLNINSTWESCLNVMAVYPASFQAKVDNAVSTWCTSSTGTPAP